MTKDQRFWLWFWMVAFFVIGVIALSMMSLDKKPFRGGCNKCRKSWDAVKEHMTIYERSKNISPITMEPASSSGIFALCETCWVELRTPDARLPYYRKLFDDQSSGWKEEKWPFVKQAVIDESNRL